MQIFLTLKKHIYKIKNFMLDTVLKRIQLFKFLKQIKSNDKE